MLGSTSECMVSPEPLYPASLPFSNQYMSDAMHSMADACPLCCFYAVSVFNLKTHAAKEFKQARRQPSG